MELEGSLPHSQEPTTYPYSEPDQSNPCALPPPPTRFHVCNINSDIILPSTPRSIDLHFYESIVRLTWWVSRYEYVAFILENKHLFSNKSSCVDLYLK
jgi:hypothetical protein